MRTRLVSLVAVSALATATLVACSRGESPDPTLTAFLDGWRSGNLDAVGFVTPDGNGVPAGTVTSEIKSLSGALTAPALSVSRKPKVTKDIADAEITVAWPLGKDITWQYATPVRLARDEGKWRMVWTASVVHPQLTSGDQLAQRRKAAPRGAILDAAGEAIVKPRPVVVVGIQPSEVTNITQLLADLDRAFKSIPLTVNLADVPARVAAAKPDAFVDVVTLRDEAYQRIKPQIHPLPGTKFRSEMWELAPTREFAAALLGGVGEVTKEIMDANPGKYQVGDQVGLGGVQRRYDDRLRGTPGVTVVLERKAPDGSINATELWKQDPKPGTPLKLALDQRIQNAADRAVGTQTKVSAIVAIKISDGTVVALGNNGPNNLALTAQVPPGSTFKMVSTLGLLDNGSVSLDGVVNCPQTFTVEGRSFNNSGNFVLGAVPFRVDFARSCNTAFASLAPKLGDNGLADAGKSLGIGVPWDLGADVFSGKVSVGGGGAERAAATFGQGTTLVSPVAQAGAVAAVVRGQWQQPKLVLDPAPGGAAPAGPTLKPTTVDPLRTMMREVVTHPNGTGRALAGTPGGPVSGKTGTAEFDSTNPNATHAWFIGWQGDIAFAVFIENGGSSTTSAVPLADRFLRNLAGA